MKDVVAIAVATTLGLTGVAAAKAPQRTASKENVLWSFLGGRYGDTPQAGVIEGANGGFFGTLSDGHTTRPTRDFGAVYELTRENHKWIEQTLYRFGGYKAGDGALPLSGLIQDSTGALYGTTAFGGNPYDGAGLGTIFKLTSTPGQKEWTEDILYKFTGSTDGQFPAGGLIFGTNGSLFGTAAAGGIGSSGGNGTVFMIAPPAAGQTNWVESTVYDFQGSTDGRAPEATLVQDGSGALYGTTVIGGGGALCQGGQGCGTVFKVTPPAQGQTAWTETVLYSFTGGADGSMPSSNLVFDSKGNLYGATNLGGPCGCGVVFELSPPNGGQTLWTESVLHAFTGAPDGQYPVGNLVMNSDGALLLPSNGGPTDDGAIVQVTPTAGGKSWREKVIYSFPPGGADGDQPIGVLLSGSYIYGATEFGGTKGSGTVFRVFHP